MNQQSRLIPALKPDQQPMRLSKHLADLGICSRREADIFIERGLLKINGHKAILGQRVEPGQRIEMLASMGQSLKEQLTIALNKPPGYVSSTPEKGYQSALTLLTPENYGGPGEAPRLDLRMKNFAPAGRLDIDSRGLLLLTQNGQVARKVTRSENGVEKEYHVRVEGGPVTPVILARLRFGLELDGQPLRRCEVTEVEPQFLRFILREGKKRQIRRMCELVGLNVVGLKRVRIGQLTLKGIPVGKWRIATLNEIIAPK